MRSYHYIFTDPQTGREIPPTAKQGDSGLVASAHNGKVAVSEIDRRWCSDGFEFNCDNGDKLRVTFALDCCDREALDWIATNGDIPLIS